MARTFWGTLRAVSGRRCGAAVLSFGAHVVCGGTAGGGVDVADIVDAGDIDGCKSKAEGNSALGGVVVGVRVR